MPTWLNAASAGAARRSNEQAKERVKEYYESEWRTSTTEEDQRDIRTLQGLYIGLLTYSFILFIICYFIEKRKRKKCKHHDDDEYRFRNF